MSGHIETKLGWERKNLAKNSTHFFGIELKCLLNS
jgi:hypothetical protein